MVVTVSGQSKIGFETLKTIAKDTFGAINHREIPFYSISFTKAGSRYLHGYIIDQVFLKANAKPEDSLVRMIEKGIS